MRDDLHVGAPLRQSWRNLLVVIPRDADCATEGPRRAVIGLVEDYRHDVRAGFLETIDRAANSAQRTLDGLPDGFDRVVPQSDLERDLLLHAKRSARSGRPPSEVAGDALKATLVEMGSARAREIDACTAAKHRHTRDLVECRRRLAHSLSAAAVDEAAKIIRGGERLDRAAPPLDLDMDLRK